ncbi:hypothetical protein ACH5RR_040255 [Cinchona calisaya]|uniref:Uncharacterized protein n=1 Tax=Cinchona calisaya TaxID=153742 RepID=A0ABD2XVM3_9GENT
MKLFCYGVGNGDHGFEHVRVTGEEAMRGKEGGDGWVNGTEDGRRKKGRRAVIGKRESGLGKRTDYKEANDRGPKNPI